MPIDVYGFTEPVWVCKRMNANLWRVFHEDVGPTYLLEISQLGAAWPLWFSALTNSRLVLRQTRAGKPVIQLLTCDDDSALIEIEQAAKSIRANRIRQRFYVGIGWREI